MLTLAGALAGQQPRSERLSGYYRAELVRKDGADQPGALGIGAGLTVVKPVSAWISGS